MFDISNLFPGSEFSDIQEDAYDDWLSYPATEPTEDFMKEFQDKFGIPLSCQHFYESSNGDLNPVFDFRTNGPTKGNPNAVVVAQVTGDIPAPTGDEDFHWQEMKGMSGKLASTILRVNTKAGDLLFPGSVSTSRSAIIARK